MFSMSATIKQNEKYILFKAEGLYTYQDMKELIDYFDRVLETNPNAKLLLDYSDITNYEQAAMKIAYNRIEKGFPKGVRIAIVYQEKHLFKFVLNVMAQSMVRTAKFFEDAKEAEEWLLDESD